MTEHSPGDQTGPPPPSIIDLVDWLEGRLDPLRREQVSAGIASGGKETADLLDWLRSVERDTGALPLVAPPALLGQRLRSLPRQLSGQGPLQVNTVAEVSVDSRRTARPIAVRGPGPADPVRYQLIYDCSAASVVLDVVPDGAGTVTLRGQVIPAPGTPPVFSATAGGPSRTLTSGDGEETGTFRLVGVPVESTTLVVGNDALVVRMTLDLSAPPR